MVKKIEITVDDHNLGYLIANEKDEPLDWGEMSREEQINALNMFASGYQFFKRFLEEE